MTLVRIVELMSFTGAFIFFFFASWAFTTFWFAGTFFCLLRTWTHGFFLNKIYFVVCISTHPQFSLFMSHRGHTGHSQRFLGWRQTSHLHLQLFLLQATHFLCDFLILHTLCFLHFLSQVPQVAFTTFMLPNVMPKAHKSKTIFFVIKISFFTSWPKSPRLGTHITMMSFMIGDFFVNSSVKKGLACAPTLYSRVCRVISRMIFLFFHACVLFFLFCRMILGPLFCILSKRS